MNGREEAKPRVPDRAAISERIRQIMESAIVADGGQVDRDKICARIVSEICSFLPIQVRVEVLQMSEHDLIVRDVMEEPCDTLNMRLIAQIPAADYVMVTIKP